MRTSTPSIRLASIGASALLAATVSADFQALTANAYSLVSQGDTFSVLDVYASFDSPQDELLDLWDVDIAVIGGVFNHNDTSTAGTNFSIGSWDPNAFFPPLFANPAIDSFVTISGATGTVVGYPNKTVVTSAPVATPQSEFSGDWTNSVPTNLQGLAVQVNPTGLPCLHHAWIGRFVVMNAAPGTKLVISHGSIGWTCAGCPSMAVDLVPQAWEFGLNPPAPAPPPGATTSKVYRVQGIPSNLDWSWEIAGTGMATIAQPYVKGVNPGDLGFFDVRDVTHRFADSINSLAASMCLAPSQLSAVALPVLLPTGGTALGCPPSGANDTLLTIRVGNPSWDLAVGAAWTPPTCLVGPCNASACGFNPTITEIPLSGQDCNGNGEDDVVDILAGISADEDGDGVPDECGACPPSDHPCTEQGGPGCSGVACCAKVCAFDPFCCAVAWDAACVESGAFLCPTPGDLDGDGVIGGGDLGFLLGAWGSPGPADLDGSGVVDGADIGLLLGLWTG